MEGGGIRWCLLGSVATVKVSAFAPAERWVMPGLMDLSYMETVFAVYAVGGH